MHPAERQRSLQPGRTTPNDSNISSAHEISLPARSTVNERQQRQVGSRRGAYRIGSRASRHIPLQDVLVAQLVATSPRGTTTTPHSFSTPRQSWLFALLLEKEAPNALELVEVAPGEELCTTDQASRHRRCVPCSCSSPVRRPGKSPLGRQRAHERQRAVQHQTSEGCILEP